MADSQPLGECLDMKKFRRVSLSGIFTITEFLGEGSFGVVVKAERGGQSYACKLIEPNQQFPASLVYLQRELANLRVRDALGSPFIV
eukprot:g4977.t1